MRLVWVYVAGAALFVAGWGMRDVTIVAVPLAIIAVLLLTSSTLTPQRPTSTREESS